MIVHHYPPTVISSVTSCWYIRLQWNVIVSLWLCVHTLHSYSPDVKSTMDLRQEYSAVSTWRAFSFSTCSWKTRMWSMKATTRSADMGEACRPAAASRGATWSGMEHWAALRTKSSLHDMRSSATYNTDSVLLHGGNLKKMEKGVLQPKTLHTKDCTLHNKEALNISRGLDCTSDLPLALTLAILQSESNTHKWILFVDGHKMHGTSNYLKTDFEMFKMCSIFSGCRGASFTHRYIPTHNICIQGRKKEACKYMHTKSNYHSYNSSKRYLIRKHDNLYTLYCNLQ